MSKKKAIESLLETARREYCFSAFQLVALKGKDVLSLAGGVTSYWPGATSVTEKTFFDLGSLTKVILTTSVIARLVDRRELELEAELENYLPALKGSALGSLRLSQLLSHRSGLLDWYPFFRNRNDWLEIVKSDPKTFLVAAPDEVVRYSDIGFLLLGRVLQENFGNLPDLFRDEVLKPLKISDLVFSPPKPAVATEWDVWRGRLANGEVFDENTAHIGPEKSGHAGLFGTALAVARFGKAWLEARAGKSDWLSITTTELFTKRRAGLTESTWAQGWDTRSRLGSSAGKLFAPQSFGHLGFPGTSLWCEPVLGGTCALLTNRVHPSRADKRIRRIRPLVYDQVFEYWSDG